MVGIGTECPDIELTQKGQVKLLLATRGHFSVMQLTNVDQLPMRGFSVTLAPLKLQVCKCILNLVNSEENFIIIRKRDPNIFGPEICRTILNLH